MCLQYSSTADSRAEGDTVTGMVVQIAMPVLIFCFSFLIPFSLLTRTRTRTRKKVFGATNGAKIYGVLFTAFAVASISGTFLTKVSNVQTHILLTSYTPTRSMLLHPPTSLPRFNIKHILNVTLSWSGRFSVHPSLLCTDRVSSPLLSSTVLYCPLLHLYCCCGE